MTAIRSIPASSLRTGMFLHKIGGSWLKHPFLRNKFLLTDPEDVRRIIEAGIDEVWIDESRGDPLEMPELVDTDEDARESFVDTLAEIPQLRAAADAPRESRRTVTGPVPLAVELERARSICLTGKAQIQSMFEELRLGNSVRQSDVLPLVEEIASSVWRNPTALISVARLKTHDDYSYLHSVAVSALMLALAKQMGLDEYHTHLAGVGGLMHDLGKAFMPLDVLNKPGKLTDAEFTIMKSHPAAGAQALQDGGAEAGVVDIALHHHEKMNGYGYPHGLKDFEITLLARMGAICDVYDAVTSIRAYKAAWDPAMAMREMARWDGHFDKQVFNAFVKSVGIYPVGALVRLSSQRLAVVAEPGEESLLKPKVRVFYSLRTKEKILVQTIDLAAPGCNDSIIGPEDPEAWDLSNLEALWL